jgi:hypothetical protein
MNESDIAVYVTADALFRASSPGVGMHSVQKVPNSNSNKLRLLRAYFRTRSGT